VAEGPFLTSVHLVFLLSAGLLLAAVVPSVLRGSRRDSMADRPPAVPL